VTRHRFISSSSNPRLKAVRRLHGRRAREAGLFLVEGHRQVEAARASGARVRELYYAPELFLGDDDPLLVVQNANVADGLLAVVERWPTDIARLADDQLVIVTEAVERPGNLGTIIRTACAAGATALVAADPRTDPFHPETVRASVGTLFRLPVHTASTEVAVERLSAGRIVVATPDAPQALWDADLSGPLALVVGNERHGVGEAWLDAADELVAIPMPGPADSLNVAVAAGIVLFEASRVARRRRRSGSRPDASRDERREHGQDAARAGWAERAYRAKATSP
jgi:TrmH family RNA methyltransferase